MKIILLLTTRVSLIFSNDLEILFDKPYFYDSKALEIKSTLWNGEC